MTRIDWKLLARYFAGETTAEEERLVARWSAASPGRRRLLAFLRQVWSARVAGVDVERGWSRVVARLDVASNGNGRAVNRRRRQLLRPPLAAAAAIALLLFTPVVLRRPDAGWQGVPPAVYATGEGERSTLRLGDGTVVRLGPSSTLRVSAHNEREVWLEGRAFFAVRSDPAHPFVAHTRGGSARVLGTRFVLDAAGDSVRVSVMEGRVALSAGGEEVEVGAGNSSRGAFGSPPSEAVPADLQAAAAWIGHVLIFQETSLADAAREIARTYDVHVLIDDTVLASRTLSAVFHEQPLEQVVSTVCRVVEARCRTSGDTVRIRS